jgi:micrococcal nuclease
MVSLLALFALTVNCSTSDEPIEIAVNGAEIGKVIRVIDGDTVELASGERVRYLGIDTPEVSPLECFAEEATQRNVELVEGVEVQMFTDGEDKDQYGRLLRYVYANGVFVNGQLVWEGYAEAESFGSEPRLYQTLVQLELSAIDAARGIWDFCGNS